MSSIIAVICSFWFKLDHICNVCHCNKRPAKEPPPTDAPAKKDKTHKVDREEKEVDMKAVQKRNELACAFTDVMSSLSFTTQRSYTHYRTVMEQTKDFVVTFGGLLAKRQWKALVVMLTYAVRTSEEHFDDIQALQHFSTLVRLIPPLLIVPPKFVKGQPKEDPIDISDLFAAYPPANKYLMQCPPSEPEKTMTTYPCIWQLDDVKHVVTVPFTRLVKTVHMDFLLALFKRRNHGCIEMAPRMKYGCNTIYWGIQPELKDDGTRYGSSPAFGGESGNDSRYGNYCITIRAGDLLAPEHKRTFRCQGTREFKLEYNYTIIIDHERKGMIPIGWPDKAGRWPDKEGPPVMKLDDPLDELAIISRSPTPGEYQWKCTRPGGTAKGCFDFMDFANLTDVPQVIDAKNGACLSFVDHQLEYCVPKKGRCDETKTTPTAAMARDAFVVELKKDHPARWNFFQPFLSAADQDYIEAKLLAPVVEVAVDVAPPPPPPPAAAPRRVRQVGGAAAPVPTNAYFK